MLQKNSYKYSIHGPQWSSTEKLNFVNSKTHLTINIFVKVCLKSFVITENKFQAKTPSHSRVFVQVE